MPRCHVRTVGSVLLLLVIAVHRTIEARPSDGGFLRLDQEPPPADEKLGKKHKICDDLEWRKYALKLLKEMPVAGLFRDLMGISKFEVSGVTSAKGRLYTVFDSLHTIGVIDERFEFCSPNNALVGDPGEESQFEGITYRPSTGTFLAVRESQLDSKQGLHPHVVELSFKADMSDYEVVKECRVEFNLSHANKGFEGLHFYDAGEQGQYVFGLCEGNHCSGGKKGREAGNGRMVVLREEMHADGSCSWRHVKTVHVPPSAAFEDYSGLDFFGTQVGITSQQDSALWVGTFDFWHLEFEQGGSVFHFPRNSHCDRVYCNIEGLHWLDQQRFVVVSDRAKSDQPFVCVEKDQSVHTFMLPARDRASSLPPGRLPAS